MKARKNGCGIERPAARGAEKLGDTRSPGRASGFSGREPRAFSQGHLHLRLQKRDGQIATTHSIYAGPRLSAIAPENGLAATSTRFFLCAEYYAVSDQAALRRARFSPRTEGDHSAGARVAQANRRA